jgi:hypothetical protein
MAWWIDGQRADGVPLAEAVRKGGRRGVVEATESALRGYRRQQARDQRGDQHGATEAPDG